MTQHSSPNNSQNNSQHDSPAPEFWLYLEPYIHAVVKGDHYLLYNTLNGACIEEKNQKNQSAPLRVVKQLVDRKNMLVAALTREDLENKQVAALVSAIRHYFMGDLLPRRPDRSRPVQLPQDVKLMKKTEKKPVENNDERGGDNGDNGDNGDIGNNSSQGYDAHQLLKHLTGLTLYLNNNPTGLPVFPADACKQFTAPCFQPFEGGSAIRQLDLDGLSEFLHEARVGMVDRIDILGGDIFHYTRLEELVELLNPMPADKHYYVRYGQLSGIGAEALKFLSSGSEGSRLEVLVDGAVRKELWEQCLDVLANTSIPYGFHFMVSSPEEFQRADQLIESSGIEEENAEYIPYYNGNNLEFFKSAVFIDKQDILEGRPGLRKIQARGIVNPLHYGRITVMSDGGVYANVNERKIGELGKDSLYDCLYRTLEESKNWRCTRSEVAPCNMCVYEALCPPISNYEYALGRFNLCHVNV